MSNNGTFGIVSKIRLKCLKVPKIFIGEDWK